MRENKGFSLVELLLSVTILAIVLTTVTAIILTGSKQFSKGSADANMQRQAQLVVNQMEDMLIDTNGGVYYNTTTREFSLYNVTKVSGVAVCTKEVIKWVAADEKLTYSKWNMKLDTTTNTYVEDGAAIYADQLLAEEISDFKVDLSDIKKDYDKDGNEIDIVQSVGISVGCIGNDGQVSYATKPLITLRNRMMLSDSPDLIFPNTPVEDDTLSLYIADAGSSARVPIQYPGTTVERNKYYNIYAIVNDSYDVNSLVNWSIQEDNTLSRIDGTGMLLVNELEPNMTLTIVASYKDNPSRKVTGVVQVIGGKEIESVRIIRRSSDDVAFEPEYDSHVELDGFSEADKSELVYTWEVSPSDWVGTFTNSLPRLSLPVIQDASRQGQFITIKLTVSAPAFGCTPKSDTVKFMIPTIGDTKDSYIERGKYEIEYNFATNGFYSVSYPSYTVYFCDEQGNRKTELDYLINDAISIRSCWAGGFVMEVTDALPANTAYYIKVIVHCVQGSDTYDYERIFYIPAVELIGMNTETSWLGIGASHAGIDYKLYGHYSAGGVWSSSKYTIEVQEIVSNAPDGITISATVKDSYVLDDENNLMRSEVVFSLSGDTSGVDTSAIKVHSIKVKIQMKDTDIFTYSTLTFTE